MHPPRTGEIAWYVTGRFYPGPNDTAFDCGYFLHLAGIAPLFAGEIDVPNAHFTFAAEPFKPGGIRNGALSLALDPAGEFSIYLQREPRGRFDDPASFAAGERIATFRRVGMVVGVELATGQLGASQRLLSNNVFSAALVWSTEFDWAGRSFDLGRLLPHGVTQWGTAAAAAPTTDAPAEDAPVPFVGSALAIGAQVA